MRDVVRGLRRALDVVAHQRPERRALVESDQAMLKELEDALDRYIASQGEQVQSAAREWEVQVLWQF